MEEKLRYIVVPLEVFNDTRLDATEKILLMRIDSFCKYGDGDGCYASNDYLSTFCGCSDRKISQSLTKLKQLGYIEQKAFNGRQRILWSRLADISSLPSRICGADSQNLRTEIIEISNKSIDNTPYNPPQTPLFDETSFNRFWDAYPKKRDKANAMKSFRKVTVPVSVLIDAIEKQKKSADWLKENGRFIPYPSTWLNGRRWEDEADVGFLHGHVHVDGKDPDSYKGETDEKEKLNLWK